MQYNKSPVIGWSEQILFIFLPIQKTCVTICTNYTSCKFNARVIRNIVLLLVFAFKPKPNGSNQFQSATEGRLCRLQYLTEHQIRDAGSLSLKGTESLMGFEDLHGHVTKKSTAYVLR